MKEGNTFDVTVGTYDGAEVCELIGSYLLYQLSERYLKKDIGLYCDDGLAVFKNVSGPHFQEIFKQNGLEIVIQCNLMIVDYLDVTLNLNDGTHKSYH